MCVSSLKLTAQAASQRGTANQLAVTVSICHPTPFTYFTITMIRLPDLLLKVTSGLSYCNVLRNAVVRVLVHKQATREGTVCQKPKLLCDSVILPSIAPRATVLNVLPCCTHGL